MSFNRHIFILEIKKKLSNYIILPIFVQKGAEYD